MGDVVARLQSVSNASPRCRLCLDQTLQSDQRRGLLACWWAILAAVEEESGRGGRRGQF